MDLPISIIRRFSGNAIIGSAPMGNDVIARKIVSIYKVSQFYARTWI
jgi:hypothetical protein